MPAFSLKAKVDQIVTREIDLLIEAKTMDEAAEKARTALETYPAPLPYDPMIHRIVTRKVRYWIPKSIEFAEIFEDRGPDVA